MKVSTDGILFGSWCHPAQAKRILDIGTGTGLLSLMLAQKTAADVNITAVELDESAANQARQNVAASPWSDRIQVVQSSIQDFAVRQAVTNNEKLFDLIITNPPWFEHTATAAHNKHNQIREGARTLARQQLGLTLSVLLDICQALLASAGNMYLVLPASAESKLLNLAKQRDFELLEKCNVSASPGHKPHCQMWRFAKKGDFHNSAPVTNSNTNVVIKDLRQAYSEEFVALCREYYLQF